MQVLPHVLTHLKVAEANARWAEVASAKNTVYRLKSCIRAYELLLRKAIETYHSRYSDALHLVSPWPGLDEEDELGSWEDEGGSVRGKLH